MTLFLSSPPVFAKVVYLDPETLQSPEFDGLPDASGKPATSSVWGEMEGAARRAAEKAGVMGRAPTPRANEAIFEQALASQLDLPNDVSLGRLFDFRIANDPNDQTRKVARQRSLIDLLLRSEVPEPATWLYLLLGFGLIGGLLRWRRADDARRDADYCAG